MKLVNHIDHVTWVSRPETIAANVALLSKMFDVRFDEPRTSEEQGFTMYLCWEAGLEVVCPLPEVTSFNKTLHDRLASHGEGLISIVFGVRNLEETRKRLIDSGFQPGELWGNDPTSPWRDKVSIKEREIGMHFNTWMIFGEIDYEPGVVTIDS